MEELNRLMRLTQEKERVEDERNEKLAGLKQQIAVLKEEMDKIDEPFKENLDILKEAIGDIKESIIEYWNPEWNKQYKDEETGITITRKTRQSVVVYDLKALMAQVVTFEKMPVKDVKWINKDLKALISAGIVNMDVARINEKFELAVTFPKE